MNAADYLYYLHSLQTGSQLDPILALARSAAWLDPLCLQQAAIEDLIEQDPEGLLSSVLEGLKISRRAFPALYGESLIMLRESDNALACLKHMLDSLEKMGFDFADPEQMDGNPFAYGIPLPYYGIDPLGELDFEGDWAEVYEVYMLFGMEEESERYGKSWELPAIAYDHAFLLRGSLRELIESHDCYKKLYYYLGWIFSQSGNSSVDASPEMGYQWQPLDWTPKEIEFAIDLIQQAHEIMDAAMEGEKVLMTNPWLWNALVKNLKEVEQHYQNDYLKGRKAYDLSTDEQPNPYALEWPEPGGSLEREASFAA